MTTDDATRQATDRWGRPVLDGVPQFGPLDGTDTSWPAGAMLVLGDDDVVACAAGFARAFSSEYFFTIWLIVLDAGGWTTKLAVELLDLPPRPPDPAALVPPLADLASRLADVAPGSSVVAAVADPDGGDRGERELAWTRAVLEGAAETGVAVRGVVAVGAHRDRLLHSSLGPTTMSWPPASGRRTEDERVEVRAEELWEAEMWTDEVWRDGDEDDEDDEWEPFADGYATAPLPSEIRDLADLTACADALYDDAGDDPEFVVHLLPLGPDGTVLPAPLAVHGLPDDPEPEDFDGLMNLLQAVGAPEPVGAHGEVAVVLVMPVDADPHSAHRWGILVRAAAGAARVSLRGIAAVDAETAVVLDGPDGGG